MLTKIRVQNLRSIVDSSWIELRPLTLLVGQNASGKSSILRVLPLLRQSIEKPTASPILWYGPFVDFGSFSEAANHRAQQKREPVTFEFHFEIQSGAYQRLIWDHRSLQPAIADDIEIDAKIFLQPKKSGDTYLERCDLSVKFKSQPDWTDHIKINLSASQEKAKSIEVNSVELINEDDDIQAITSESLLPLLGRKSRAGGRVRVAYPYVDPLVFAETMKLVGEIVDSRVQENTRKDIVFALPVASPARFRERIAGSAELIRKNLSTWNVNIRRQSEETIERLRRLAIANALPQMLQMCAFQIQQFSHGISYMGPIRATADRFYRFQDLAVEELDHRGANLPMLLNSLSARSVELFSAWCRENLGFAVDVQKSPGHVSVHVQSELSANPVNITDTGLGISQVLPIALQIWLALQGGPRSQRTTALVMEQPELHLHPQLQTEIGKVLIAAVANRAPRTRLGELGARLFVETHSEAIVNAIGAAVRQGTLAPKDVQILVFELNQVDGRTEIRRAHFDDTGVLSNWPYGFLAP